MSIAAIEQEFQTDPVLHSALLGHFRRTWRDRLLQNLRRFAAALDIDVEPLCAALGSVDLSRPLRSEFFWLCHSLEFAIEGNNITLGSDTIRRLMDLSLSDLHAAPMRVRSLFEERWETEWADLARLNAARRGMRMSIRPLLPHQLAPIRRRIETALALFEAVDPELHSELRECSTDIRVFAGNVMTTQAVAPAFGMMAFGFVPGEPVSDGFLLGQLAHEAGHIRMYLLTERDPLFTNDDTPRYRLSARADLRPMAAVLHAAFVYARTARVLERAAERFPEDPSLATCRDHARAGFEKAYGFIRRDAHLTPLGERLVSSMPRTAQRAAESRRAS